MRFTLTIHLGNDAMQNLGDVATALEHLAQALDVLEADPEVSGGRIHDVNGNGVGTWAIYPDADERTRIGNTPTCEDCGETLDHCTCEVAE